MKEILVIIGNVSSNTLHYKALVLFFGFTWAFFNIK